MSAPQKAFSRGSSLLSALLLFALGGSGAVALDAIPLSDTSFQLAAIPAAGEINELSDTIPEQPWKDVVVRFACVQATDTKDINKLTQTCQPGFSYLVKENKGIITVTPTPRFSCPSDAPGTSRTCADPAHREPIKGCIPLDFPQTCSVRYCVGDSKDTCTNLSVRPGEDLNEGIGEKRIPAISSLLNEPGANKSDILSNLGIPDSQQNELSKVLAGDSAAAEQTLQNINASQQDIQAQLNNLATCADPSCGTKIAELQSEAAGLERTKQYIEQAQTLSTQKVLAPPPPGDSLPQVGAKSQDRLIDPTMQNAPKFTDRIVAHENSTFGNSSQVSDGIGSTQGEAAAEPSRWDQVKTNVGELWSKYFSAPASDETQSVENSFDPNVAAGFNDSPSQQTLTSETPSWRTRIADGLSDWYGEDVNFLGVQGQQSRAQAPIAQNDVETSIQPRVDTLEEIPQDAPTRSAPAHELPPPPPEPPSAYPTPKTVLSSGPGVIQASLLTPPESSENARGDTIATQNSGIDWNKISPTNNLYSSNLADVHGFESTPTETIASHNNPEVPSSSGSSNSGSFRSAQDVGIDNSIPTDFGPQYDTYELPSEFSAVRNLSPESSLRDRINALGSYQARKDFVAEYFPNELPNYSGTAAQNAKLVQLATEYRGSAAVASPINTAALPIAETVRIQQVASTYQGDSIVEFCKLAGYSSCASSGADRLHLVEIVGMTSYSPTAQNNLQLLYLLKKNFGGSQ